MPSAHPDLSLALAELSVALIGLERVQDAVDVVGRHARTLFDAAHVAVTSRSRGHEPSHLGVDDEAVARVHRLQHELDEGPAHDVGGQVELAMSSDLARESRWPRWRPVAVDEGVRAVLTTAMPAQQDVVATLTLYSPRAGAFGAADLQALNRFAGPAAAGLWAAENVEHLRKALASRTMIGQAQGMLMQRFDLEPDRAFAVLRRYSQNANVKLHEIAGIVIDRGELPSTAV